MAQLIVEGATKRVVQGLPEHEKISFPYSDSHWCTENTCQELIEWLGAWVRKRGFLHWVLLLDCASFHRKASLMESVRATYLECHVLFNPGGLTSELQSADISIGQPLKHLIKEQAMQIFAESVCRDDAVLDLRLGTMKRLMTQWVIHACTEVEKKTRITTKAWRHLSWTLAEAPMLAERFTREFLNGTLFEEEPTELAEDEPEEESDLILHDDDDDAEDAAHEVHGARCGRCVSREHGHSCCIGSRADLHGGCRNRRRRTLFLCLRCAYGRHPPKL